jgi:quercetin dioxygenase-like cupin family protein
MCKQLLLSDKNALFLHSQVTSAMPFRYGTHVLEVFAFHPKALYNNRQKNNLSWRFSAFKTQTEVGTMAEEKDAKQQHQNEMVFPIGAPNTGFAQYFVGQSFLQPLSTSQAGIFNVTFEPACRNNWHIHHATKGGGQILICVAGRGYYQEWGKPAQELHPGDIVNIPPEVKHWHGAAADSWFSHLAVEVPGEGTSNEWCEPVDADEYTALK